MEESPAGQVSPPSEFGQRPPIGPLPVLAAVAAVGLIGSAVLPWIRWSFATAEDTGIGFSFSLWDMVRNGSAGELGAGWVPLVEIGMAAALFGALAELIQRPVTKLPRVIGLAGFVCAVVALCLGLVVGVTNFGEPSSLSGGLTPSFGLGFWLALATAVVGAIASLVHFEAPPNPEHRPAPFAPSPWGPPPGILPAGYYPPGVEWLEYVERGEAPPGYVAPAYRPAIYPTPGHITPAYTLPGNPGPEWGPTLPIPEDATGAEPGADGATGPAPGHLVVLEAGKAKVVTVSSGQRLLVGRDPEAEIRVADKRVSERHATIERRGDGWAVQDVDAMNPTRLIDAWGTNRQVRGETEITSGKLVVGDVVITLYTNQA